MASHLVSAMFHLAEVVGGHPERETAVLPPRVRKIGDVEPGESPRGDPPMRKERMVLAWLAWALGAVLFSSGSVGAASPVRDGVIVESLEPGGAGAEVGLHPGDVLLSWRRDARTGTLESFFDWASVLAEEQPRGGLVLVLEAERRKREVTLPLKPVQMTVRPPLKGLDLGDFLEGRRLLEAKDFAGGIARWDALAARWDARKSWGLAAWLRMRAALAWEAKRNWAQAMEEWDRALTDSRKIEAPEVAYTVREGRIQNWNSAEKYDVSSEESEGLETFARQSFGESLRLARAIHLRGYVAWRQGNLSEAEGHYIRTLALRERLAPESADTAATLNNLGIVCEKQGWIDKARDYFGRALALREKLDPGGLDAARIMNNLGALALGQGEYGGAERLFVSALERYRRLEPGGQREAGTLNNLGELYIERGDFLRAQETLKRALALKEKLAPGTQGHSTSLVNLGILCNERGDIEAAEGYYRQALEIRRRTDPKSVDTALLIMNLGNLAQYRLDYPEAEARFREALALIEAQAPGKLDVALVLSNLGVLMRQMGREEESETLHRKAYEIRKSLAPTGPDTADSLINLSVCARARGDLVTAQSQVLKALEIEQKEAPGYIHEGIARRNLSEILRDRGDLPGAEAQLRTAAEIFGRLAPGSAQEAETYYLLGVVLWGEGRKSEAATSLFKAVEALEAQRDRLGGTEEGKAGFASHYADYYRDLILLLLELKRDREAFHVMERSRAHGLLALLSRRDLVFDTDIPPELERERRELAAKYDRGLDALGKINDKSDPGAAEAARAHLETLRRQRDDLTGRIAKASPRLAALRQPEPLDLAGALGTLDPGTVLLAYSIGAKRSALFVLGPGTEFRTVPLPFGKETLGREVRRFLNILESQEDPRAFASALGGRLLGPAKEQISRARRLLISPDEPLHVLPFAALADPSSGEGFRYLAQAAPVHTVLSATLYAELQRGRKENRETTLAAFGDPAYPPPGDPRARLRRGMELVSLPGTRAEVEDLGALFSGRSRLYLGPEATERTAKALGRDVALIHFACHGFLDGDFPLDSALALAVPEAPGEGAENGLLQVWEIFESVRLDADLVTLSACETGLGKEMGGEGLVGLTRAFQYAGARTVLASLWKVPDAATAVFMRQMYAQIRAGRSKDEALRCAQAEFLAGPVEVSRPGGGTGRLDVSHPFYWGGFVLAGHWK
jgi:CHAT domain-containing protein/tetratricopeptide (TPR) repeat protein